MSVENGQKVHSVSQLQSEIRMAAAMARKNGAAIVYDSLIEGNLQLSLATDKSGQELLSITVVGEAVNPNHLEMSEHMALVRAYARQ